MKTEILDSLTEYDKSISRAAAMLTAGAIVAIPTETVYGLAANCFDEVAILNIFKAKGRPQDNPLIVHISSMEMLDRVATDIPDVMYKLAEKFWPGPLTVVLKKKPDLPSCVSAGLDTVAVRMPSDKTAHDIISAAKLPLAAPSANLSGMPSPTSAKHVINDLSGKIDAVVVGGECTVGVESTVITLATDKPRLLRPGAVTAEQLSRILPDLVVDDAVLHEIESIEKVSSPGMKYKHYSPKTATFLVEGKSADFSEFVNGKINSLAICFDEDASSVTVKKLVYGTSADEYTFAHNVFSSLREADEYGVDSIYIHAPSKKGVGLAVYNRLIRAAAFKVIKL